MTGDAPICEKHNVLKSRNPHPDAGLPTQAGVAVGYTWECIPCLVATRNRVGDSWRACQAEAEGLWTALAVVWGRMPVGNVAEIHVQHPEIVVLAEHARHRLTHEERTIRGL